MTVTLTSSERPFKKPKKKAASDAVFLCSLGLSLAVKISSSSRSTIQIARGETIKLECKFSLASTDVGALDIEWVLMNPDMTANDDLLLNYVENKTHEFAPSNVRDRLKFVSSDPGLGDASIELTDLKLSDTGTYLCKVKKTPGLDTQKIVLAVLGKQSLRMGCVSFVSSNIVHGASNATQRKARRGWVGSGSEEEAAVKPSKPKCWIEGNKEKGGEAILKCKSSEGSIPLVYTWERVGGQSASLPPTAVKGLESGDLIVRNNSDAFSGTYHCMVKNGVGQEECVAHLTTVSSANRAGIIAGAIIGALLLLLLLLLLLCCLCWCCRKRRNKYERENEIMHDSDPPQSRASSRASSLRSHMGYQSHPAGYLRYNMMARNDVNRTPSLTPSARSDKAPGYKPSHMGRSPSSVISKTPSFASSPPPEKMEGYTLSRIGNESINDVSRNSNTVCSQPPGKMPEYKWNKIQRDSINDVSRTSSIVHFRPPERMVEDNLNKIHSDSINDISRNPSFTPSQPPERMVGYSLNQMGKDFTNDVSWTPGFTPSPPPAKTVGFNLSHMGGASSNNVSRIPSFAQSPPPEKPTEYNLNRMGGVPIMVPAVSREGYIV
nr:PREDICTED: coxsackievirus and adenovirus receptor homolog [Latimeria chalumnae]|eukprot:XP_014351942.1 PREDICTED: coxsackievirus and adenovirus receptor homolog [Latimeria chalumnae]